MQAFEYQTVRFKIRHLLRGALIDHEAVNLKLNELGAQGWELISSSENHNSGTLKELVLILKRPIE